VLPLADFHFAPNTKLQDSALPTTLVHELDACGTAAAAAAEAAEGKAERALWQLRCLQSQLGVGMLMSYTYIMQERRPVAEKRSLDAVSLSKPP
jgi:hypothetical protein